MLYAACDHGGWRLNRLQKRSADWLCWGVVKLCIHLKGSIVSSVRILVARYVPGQEDFVLDTKWQTNTPNACLFTALGTNDEIKLAADFSEIFCSWFYSFQTIQNRILTCFWIVKLHLSVSNLPPMMTIDYQRPVWVMFSWPSEQIWCGIDIKLQCYVSERAAITQWMYRWHVRHTKFYLFSV